MNAHLSRLRPLLSFAILALVGFACAGSAGKLENGLFQGRQTRYRIGPPDETWHRVALTSADNDLVWTQSHLDAVIQVNSSCAAGLDVPLQALTNHLLIGFTERDKRSQQKVPLDGREALVTHLVMKLDGVPREIVLTVIKKDTCVYDFALVAPPGEPFVQARHTYDILVAGFRTEPRP